MAQRTGRRVAGAANLPAHGKKVKDMNKMNPGVAEDAKLGDGTETDHSAGNDKPGKASGKPANAHKGPHA